MPQRLFQNCREPGCRNRTNARSGYCEAHETANTSLEARKKYDEARRDDTVARMYHTSAWFVFRRHVLNRNPICQRIGTDMKQCRYAAMLLHHLVSPRVNPALFLVPSNVIALCDRCHPPDEGTPDWIEGRDYVPSVIEAATCV